MTDVQELNKNVCAALRADLSSGADLVRSGKILRLSPSSMAKRVSQSVERTYLRVAEAIALTRAGYLGAAFWNRLLNPLGLVVTKADKVCLNGVRSQFSGTSHTITTIFEDGVANHIEKGQSLPQLQEHLSVVKWLVTDFASNPLKPTRIN